MPYDDVLVHRATPVETRRTGQWVEGEWEEEPVQGVSLDCALFLPMGTESGAGRGRRVREPTVLLSSLNDDGVPPGLTGESELLILAPELTGATPVRWMLTGDPQPFGRPGDDPIGYQAGLRRIDD